MQSPTYFLLFRASGVGCIHLNNVGLFTQGISLVARTTSDSSRDRFVRAFADLLPLTVGLLDGLVALSGTEALPEAIGQPQTHAATMVIRHPAGLRDITEEVAGIGAHRPPGIEEGEREGEAVVEKTLIHLEVHIGQVVTLVGEGQLPTRPLRIDGVRPVSARRVAEVERTPIEEPTPASAQSGKAMLGRYLFRDIAKGRPEVQIHLMLEEGAIHPQREGVGGAPPYVRPSLELRVSKCMDTPG